jgi:hypothetical protein
MPHICEDHARTRHLPPAAPSHRRAPDIAGCTTAPPSFPPAPPSVQEITVQQPSNRTGRDLLVDQPGLLGEYFGEKRSTVADVLAGDLRSLLRDRGFRVLTPSRSRPG